MNALSVSGIVFASVFGGAVAGRMLRTLLPSHHLEGDSKDMVRLGMGLIGTMVALLLGMLVASSKSAYDAASGDLSQMSAKVLFLDRVLANYGPETRPVRDLLRGQIEHAVSQIWPEEEHQSPHIPPPGSGEALFSHLEQLTPQTDAQRALKAQALSIVTELGQMRWVLFVHAGSTVIKPLLIVVIFWLTLIFVSFGLHAPANPTVMITLLLCALSVSAAVFLVIELDHPFSGWIRISSHTLRNVLQHIGT